tara:strand:+ start:278 stop:493 length:216 start_codon:yes stop_codon:yes gene_type:complete
MVTTKRAEPQVVSTVVTSTGDRIRINVSTSVKGVKTYDCTVESQHGIDYAFDLSRELVARLDSEYPNNIHS